MKRYSLFEVISILGIISVPYIFLTVSDINFTLFDFFLVISFFLVLVSNKIRILNDYKILLALCSLFIINSLIPLIRSLYVREAFIATCQYSFIFLIMFTVYFTLDIHVLKKGIDLMVRVWVFFLTFNLILLNDANRFRGGRFMGFYKNPGTYGVIIAMIFPFFISNFKSQGKFSKLFLIYGMIVSLFFLTISGSRAALFSLICIAIIYLLATKISGKAKVGIFLFIFGVFISLPYLSDAFGRNALSRMTTTENISVRLGDFDVAIKNVQEFFFIGTGLHVSGKVLEEASYRPHNFYIAYLLETGFFGFLFILILSVYFIFKNIPQLLRQTLNKNLVYYDIGYFCSGIVFLVSQQFSTPFAYRGIWFFLMVATIDSVSNKAVRFNA